MLPEMKFAYKITMTNLGRARHYQLNFAITYWCNSKCTFCSIWEIRPKNELTLEEIEKFAEKIPHIQWLRLTGGEPFMRKDYVEIVRAFDKSLPNLILLSTPTNSIKPDEIYAKIAEVLGFFKRRYVITVSMDGDREMHDKVRGVPGNFDKAIYLYKKLMELKKIHKNFNVVFGYTIYPENVGNFNNTLKAVQEIIPEVDVEDFHINIFQVSPTYFHNQNIIAPEDFYERAKQELTEILKMKKKATDVISFLERKYLSLGIEYLETHRTPMPCNIMDLSCFVDSWGNVYPCIIFGEKLGNLRDNDYDLNKIMDSERAKQVSEMAKKLQCPNCWTPCEAHQLILSNMMKMQNNNFMYDGTKESHNIKQKIQA